MGSGRRQRWKIGGRSPVAAVVAAAACVLETAAVGTSVLVAAVVVAAEAAAVAVVEVVAFVAVAAKSAGQKRTVV